MRTTTVTGLLLIVVALLVTGAFWLLGGPEAEQRGTRLEEPDMDIVVKDAERHDGFIMRYDEWPWAGFKKDLRELRNERPTDRPPLHMREGQIDTKVRKHKFTIRYEGPVAGVVEELKAQLATIGVEVTTLGQELPDMNVRIFRVDTHAWDVIQLILMQTQEVVLYAMDDKGICIGEERVVQEYNIRKARREKQRLGNKDRENKLLDAPFRPDFADAHVEDIARQILAATQVEVVIGADIWGARKRLTWRVKEPITLRKVMGKLAKEFGGMYRIRDGRIFLFRF